VIDLGPFQPYVDLGYTSYLLPIIPPGAAISTRRNLEGDAAAKEAQRVASLRACRGKVPGHCYEQPSRHHPHGLWGGKRDWSHSCATEADIERWAPWGGGVGLQAKRYPGLDVDVTVAGAAEKLRVLASEMLGYGPVRRGNDPKLLMMYRADEDIKKQRVAFTLPEVGSGAQAVEFLGDGQYYVVSGIHPKTLRPYRFDEGEPPDPRDLTPVTKAMVDALMAAVRVFVVEELGGELVMGRLGRGAPKDPAERKLMAPIKALSEDDIALRELMARRVAYDLTVADTAGSAGDVDGDDDDDCEMVENVRQALADNWNAVQLINGASVHDSQLRFGGDCARAGLAADETQALTAALLQKAFDNGRIEKGRYQDRLSDTRTVNDGYRNAYRQMAGSVVIRPDGRRDFEDGDEMVNATDDREPTLGEVRAFNRRRRQQGPAPANDNVPPLSSRMPTRLTAGALEGMEFAPARYLLPGFIGEGVTILAGKPKVGKSWLALDIALAVAMGEPVLGATASQGAVLYCALEDNMRRLKGRLKSLRPFGGLPDSLTLWTEMPLIDEGGLDQLKGWILAADNPALIIIDTLAKVRKTKGREESSYEADYKAITPLQRLAMESGVSIIIIHHVRKAPADDPLEAVSGTYGLTGAADCVVTLDKTTKGVTLNGRGRDIEEFAVAVQFNKGTCRCGVLGDADVLQLGHERQELLDYVRIVGRPVSNTELCMGLGRTRKAVSKMVLNMVADGQLVRVGAKCALPPEEAPAPITTAEAVRRLVG